jgi:hypothetical protein
MFDSNHYVPVLRWKAAEKEALRHLFPESRKGMTPLIEFMMPRPNEYKGETKKERDARKEIKNERELLDDSVAMFKAALPKISEDISKCWGDAPIFVDMHFIDSSIRAQALAGLLEEGKKHNLFMIPVVNMVPVIDLESDRQTREVAVKYAKDAERGLGLRLLRSNLRRETLDSELEDFLKANGLVEKQLDLLVDFGVADDEYESLIGCLRKIPNLGAWRTFTILSGAFPPDLTEFKVDEDNRISRLDWLNWNNPTHFEKLGRHPSFGDYTIQCPVYKEPPRISYPSASIRYTANDEWLIMRGKGGPDKESKQYLAHARLLTELKEFDGADFSYGDAYIVEKGKDLSSPETGSPTTWLIAGVNRHLTKVAKQIANLRET